MIVSPRCAQALLSLPPVRGVLSVIFLVILVSAASMPGEHDAAMRVGVGLAVLLLGAPIWAATLAGFVRDVRRPHQRERAVVVASRPRPVAAAISWIALGAFVMGTIGFGLVTGLEGPDGAVALCLLAVVLGLPIATVLPRLSRWLADCAGVVTVSELGVHVIARPGEEAAPIPWDRLGPIGRTSLPAATPSSGAGRADLSPGDGSAERPSADLPPDAGRELGRRVRWHPGARAAVGRWATEGFAPTVAEVRALRLYPGWSADPAAHVPGRWARGRRAAELAWALLLCAALLACLIGLVVTGTSPWWILPAFGWAPLLGIWFLVPRRGEVRPGSRGRGRPARGSHRGSG